MLSLFLEKQVHVIYTQRCELLVGTLKVKQQTAEGNENRPVPPYISTCYSCALRHEAYMFPEVEPSSNR